jgi:hypothetical protein
VNLCCKPIFDNDCPFPQRKPKLDPAIDCSSSCNACDDPPLTTDDCDDESGSSVVAELANDESDSSVVAELAKDESGASDDGASDDGASDDGSELIACSDEGGVEAGDVA